MGATSRANVTARWSGLDGRGDPSADVSATPAVSPATRIKVAWIPFIGTIVRARDSGRSAVEAERHLDKLRLRYPSLRRLAKCAHQIGCDAAGVELVAPELVGAKSVLGHEFG